MSTFTLDTNVQVKSIPDLTEDQLLSFPAFKIWRSTLEDSLARQSHPEHPFRSNPYVLREIEIQAIDRWGGRLGFVKFKALISNSQGETIPGSVFLRGGSVGMLVSDHPRGKLHAMELVPDMVTLSQDDMYSNSNSSFWNQMILTM